MRVLSPQIDMKSYQKIFSHLEGNKSTLVIWQTSSEGSREIVQATLKNYQEVERKFSCYLAEIKNFQTTLPIYCYGEDAQFIFKSTIESLIGNEMTLAYPATIKLLEEPDVIIIRGQLGNHLPDIMKVKRLKIDDKPKSMNERSSRDQEFLNHEFEGISLDEEDKLYADKREAPRARPNDDKWVKVKILGHSEIHNLKLFDLSRGGIGFITNDNEVFKKDQVVHIVGFDTFDLDDPLVGTIVALRPLNDMQFEWKVGVKFEEGQD